MKYVQNVRRHRLFIKKDVYVVPLVVGLDVLNEFLSWVGDIFMLNEPLVSNGDVLQIDPNNAGNPMFAGCMLTVTEVKPWGVQGYVQTLGENGQIGGQVYYREKWENLEKVGSAVWIRGSWSDLLNGD